MVRGRLEFIIDPFLCPFVYVSPRVSEHQRAVKIFFVGMKMILANDYKAEVRVGEMLIVTPCTENNGRGLKRLWTEELLRCLDTPLLKELKW